MTFEIKPCTEADQEKIRNFIKPALDITSYTQYSGFAVCALVVWLIYGMQDGLNLPPNIQFILVAVLFVMAVFQVFMFRRFILPSIAKRMHVAEKEVITGNVVAYNKRISEVTLDIGEAENRIISLFGTRNRADAGFESIRNTLQPGDKLVIERTPGSMGFILYIERY